VVRALGAAGAGILVAATLMIWLTINARRAQLHRLRAVPGLGAEVGGRRRDRADGRAGRGGLLVLAAGILALVVAVVLIGGARSAERRPG
jgi:hypothetical protein